MSKPVKNLIASAYAKEFAGLNGAVLIDIRGVEANDNNALRTELAGKSIKVRVIKNSLAKGVFKDGELEGLSEFLEGPAAMVYPAGEDASVVGVARELIDWAKKLENMEFKGAVMDGISFGPDEIKKLSEYPTKEEAQAKVVQIVLTPGQNLVGAITAPGKNLAGIIKTIQEKLEAGETIAKVG
ncbi:MAG: 50S ribosomal protein L10 [Planctomycetota bacterium]